MTSLQQKLQQLNLTTMSYQLECADIEKKEQQSAFETQVPRAIPAKT